MSDTSKQTMTDAKCPGCGHLSCSRPKCDCPCALHAEIASLRAQLAEAQTERDTFRDGYRVVERNWHAAEKDRADLLVRNHAEAEALRAQKDAAYSERNQILALVARMALALGWRAGVGRHPDLDDSWEDDWRTILFIDLPTGQASWHFHDSETPLLAGLPQYAEPWDGHSTPEKYARVARTRTGDLPDVASLRAQLAQSEAAAAAMRSAIIEGDHRISPCVGMARMNGIAKDIGDAAVAGLADLRAALSTTAGADLRRQLEEARGHIAAVLDAWRHEANQGDGIDDEHLPAYLAATAALPTCNHARDLNKPCPACPPYARFAGALTPPEPKPLNAPPTHRCKVCGALWWRGVVDNGVTKTPSWSLRSEKCGPCCDNAPMGEQIEPIPPEPKPEQPRCSVCGGPLREGHTFTAGPNKCDRCACATSTPAVMLEPAVAAVDARTSYPCPVVPHGVVMAEPKPEAAKCAPVSLRDAAQRILSLVVTNPSRPCDGAPMVDALAELERATYAQPSPTPAEIAKRVKERCASEAYGAARLWLDADLSERISDRVRALDPSDLTGAPTPAPAALCGHCGITGGKHNAGCPEVAHA